ncbi:DUF3592 domain-containing protein [Spirochaeta africana]|uniref:DUF3592 domain-containing protein n=1 Tax=Spirochaeta africana (strain ATCC 700263 / DSM 8902 / Z-7692) TaxID=889378 RepID=H9UI46_SPIAZ|nr:DUF3592 domain-containing protein [Spirochaeta africana]AFG37189.1 Protein of unknown function (DUF3592) [Spirochaeta africana DSM 8902]
MKIAHSVSKIFFGLTAVLAVAAAGYAVSAGLFIMRAEITAGEVVAYEESDRSIQFGTAPGGGMHFFPVVEYTAVGETRRLTADRGTQERRYAIGQQVMVRYLPDNPQRARIATLWGEWGAALVLLFTALLFGASALVFRFRFDES